MTNPIAVPVRANYCTDCPDKAFEHEIGMNTPQSGKCLVDGCGCVALSSPSREELGDEVERLLIDNDSLTKEVERLTKIVNHYQERYP